MFTVIPCTVRNLIRKTSAYSTLRKIRFRIDYLRWDKSSVPPPHYVKQKIVLEYARKYQCKTLIETGTHLGFMVDVMKNHFKKIDSIELDQALYENATKQFGRYPHVAIHQGDSARLLAELLTKIDVSSCLFWLDGHYSGGITARGLRETPIIYELHAILQYVEAPVILIDDARLFTGKHDYPHIQEVREIAADQGFSFAEGDDVIRLTPLQSRPSLFRSRTSFLRENTIEVASQSGASERGSRCC